MITFCTTQCCYYVCALADALVFLQESELQVEEGSNVSICVEIELPGELLADIELTFVTLSGGPGAGENDIVFSYFRA